MSDLIAEAATSTSGQCEFVGAVAFITKEAMKSGVISGSEKGAIKKCVARARTPSLVCLPGSFRQILGELSPGARVAHHRYSQETAGSAAPFGVGLVGLIAVNIRG